MPRKPQSDAVAAMRAREPVAAPDFAGASEPGEGAASGGGGRDGRAPRLPQPCPVTPLGSQGVKLFFLDSLNQIQVATTRCEKGDLMLWFGNDWLDDIFPSWKAGKKDEPPERDGFNQKHVQIALVEDCRARGIFNPQGRVFGRGAHRFPDDDEQLVLHMGRQVMLANAPDARGKRSGAVMLRPAGRVLTPAGGEAFYPAGVMLSAPAEQPASADEARDLLALFGRWYWVDAEASALLLLGMVAQMFICGALTWRTHVWLAGPTASGKTSLQELIRAMLGNWCLHTEDATEAAIRQVLGDDTLPVMIDEAEAHDKPERLASILNLMKKASSGAKMYRGGQDHKATEFTAQSCFLLSSVLHASMRGEDRNRIAILEMRAIPENARALKVDKAEWARSGRRMHRRMVEAWPRFAETLAAYKAEIARRGFEGRSRDTYGTLLACADLLLFDRDVHAMIPSDDAADEGDGRVRRIVATVLPAIQRGQAETQSDVERVIVHLSTHMLPGAHGRPQEPIGYWLERAMTLRTVQGQFSTDPDTLELDREARDKLKSHGLRVVSLAAKPGEPGKFSIAEALAEDWAGAWLAVAYKTNKATCEIFRGSDWADGGWTQSLGKIPGAIKGNKVRFYGKPDNAILVPLKVFQGEDEEG